MKEKILKFLIITTMLFGLSSCVTSKNNNNDREHTINNSTTTLESTQSDIPNINESGTEENKEKITNKITNGSIFSEGLAFVNCYGSDKTYCIDKNGYVVFKLDERLFSCLGFSYTNSLVLINGKLYDKTGKAIAPEEVAVTEFYDFALSNGHIFATVIESSFETSKKKLGVMNFAFEWLIEPSEELYNAFTSKNTLSFSNTIYYNAIQKTYDGIVTYRCLNMSNRKLTEITQNEINFDNTIPYFKLKEKYPTMHTLTNFTNGKAAILFYNADTNIYYVSMIDKQGNLLFEPVDIGYYYNPTLKTDGNIIIWTSYFGWEITSMDIQGKILGTATNLNTNIFGNDGQLAVDICDNILRVYNSYSNETIYLNSELQPLF